MSGLLEGKFIFQNQEFDIAIQSKDNVNLPQKVLLSMCINKKYEIQSNITNSVFQSIITYFSEGILPNIQQRNIEEYEQISNELQIITIIELIQKNRNIYTEIQKNIKMLKDNSISDKAEIEHQISSNFDTYLEIYGEEMINAPIQSLYNILSYKDCNFTKNDLLYNLIISNYQKTNNGQIFTLFQFIDGNSISQENQIDCFENELLHFGYKPKFDIPVLIKKKPRFRKSKQTTQRKT